MVMWGIGGGFNRFGVVGGGVCDLNDRGFLCSSG